MTPRQRDALAFIRAYQAENEGVSPSLREIATGICLTGKSQGAVHALLTKLERDGFIRRGRNQARSIEVLNRPTPTYVPPKRPTLGSYTVSQLIAELEARGITFPARIPVAPLERASPVCSPVCGAGAPHHAEAPTC